MSQRQFQNNITTLARRLQPFLLQTISNSGDVGGCVTHTCAGTGWRAEGGTATTRTLIHETAFQLTSAGNARGTWAVDLQQDQQTATDVAGGAGSFIGAGAWNRAGGNYSATVGGYDNTINSAPYCAIVGGTTNSIGTGADYAVIVGGQANSIAANVQSSMVAGANNECDHTGCTVIGTGAATNNDNQLAHGISANGLSSGVAVQASQYVMALLQTMTTGTWYDLEGSVAVDGLSIPTDSVWNFRILLTGSTAGMANISAYEITGVIKNDGGTTSLLTSTVTVVHEDTAGHDARVQADDTNDKLLVQVQQNTGSNQTNVWHATVHTSEINSYS